MRRAIRSRIGEFLWIRTALIAVAPVSCHGSAGNSQERGGVSAAPTSTGAAGAGTGGHNEGTGSGGLQSQGGTSFGGTSPKASGASAATSGGTHAAPPDASDSSLPDASLSATDSPIAAAVTHACAIVGGAVYCWGQNQFGQLGNGETTGSNSPVRVTGLSSDAQTISAGWRLSCSLVNGNAFCWGDSGSNSLTGSLTAVPVRGIPAAAQLLSAAGNTGFVVSNSALYGWGGDFAFVAAMNQNLESGVQSVASGPCALVLGAAKCWGQNNVGQLGDGTANDSNVPVQVQGLISGVTSIARGWMHACAVMNGTVYCWGDNTFGQLGHQPGSSSSDEICIRGVNPPGDYCNPLPTQVLGLPAGVQNVKAGTYHSCAMANGVAYCWGANAFGQLGDGSTANSYQPVPVKGLTSVTDISAGAYPDPQGYDMTCAVADGNIYCWGANAYGQLGDGTTSDSAVPVKVQF